MGKSITDFSSVTTVGLDLAKHVFQVHGVDSIRPRCAAFPRAVGLLARRWERARAGEGQLALIVGEPGLGASPTASSLSRAARSPHPDGRCTPRPRRRPRAPPRRGRAASGQASAGAWRPAGRRSRIRHRSGGGSSLAQEVFDHGPVLRRVGEHGAVFLLCRPPGPRLPKPGQGPQPSRRALSIVDSPALAITPAALIGSRLPVVVHLTAVRLVKDPPSR